MNDAIIVLNAGSSSLKFSFYSVTGQELGLLARGQIEGLGASAKFSVQDRHGQKLGDQNLHGGSASLGHAEAFTQIAEWLREHFAKDYSPAGVGHRVVHGGSRFTAPVLIDSAVIGELEKLVPLAPLHQPQNLAGIRAVMQTHPGLPQVACFDTSFHQGRARVTERFGLPDELFQQGIRRWGFHGLSYEFISAQLETIAPEIRKGRVIVAHLGNGASLCAMKNGRCVDTTMSFSVLDGLPMGTRCGSLDPGVILFLLSRGNTAAQIEELLYTKSGLLGISGISNDLRDLLKSDNPLAAEAIDYFVYQIIREIGSLTAALGGLDGLVFTAGVGQNSPVIRHRVCQGLGWLNISIDSAANQENRVCISSRGSAPSVWVLATDEERVIATHTLGILRSHRVSE